jgi:hypothetical protein
MDRPVSAVECERLRHDNEALRELLAELYAHTLAVAALSSEADWTAQAYGPYDPKPFDADGSLYHRVEQALAARVT